MRRKLWIWGGLLLVLLTLCAVWAWTAQRPRPPATPPEVDQQRPPLIFIPGLMGSKLYNLVDGREEEVWENIERIINDDLAPLALSPDGETPARDDPLYNTIHTRQGTPGLVDKVGGAMDFYAPLVDHFVRGHGYTEGEDFWVYTYDWRHNPDEAADRLDALVDQVIAKTGSQQVTIVAHSLGGLVTRHYLADPKRAAKVGRAVLVGTPFLGTPEAYFALLGQLCFQPILTTCLPDPKLLQFLAANYPSFYETFPSEAYFALNGGGFFNLGPQADFNDQCTQCLTYAETYSTTMVPAINMGLWTAARQRQAELTRLTDWNGVPVDIVAGTGVPTIVGIQVQERFSWLDQRMQTVYVPIKSPAGDGTVTLTSVSLGNSENGLDLRGTATYQEFPASHIDLVKDPQVLRYIDKRLGLADIFGPLQEKALTPETTSFAQIVAYGARELYAYDAAGNYTGPLGQDGSLVNGIPGSAYDSTDGAPALTVAGGQVYTITVIPTGFEPLDINLIHSTLTGTLTTTLYTGVPVTAQSRVYLVGDPFRQQTWQVDKNGDGQIDETLVPTLAYSEDQPVDTEAPQVKIDLAGQKGPEGYYISPLIVSITATDGGGAGVGHIYYAFDDDPTPRLYDGPFVVPAQAHGRLLVLAHDRAGNQRQLAVQIGPLKGTRCYLPLVAR